jgi:ABC-type transport system involved in Fe-S cluster assembly fused permease/ATPase subunit
VQDPYIKSVLQGLIVSGLVLSIAGTIGLSLFVTIAVTQAGWLIAVTPVVFIAFFTLITMVLLKRDATARQRGQSSVA